MKTRFSLSFFFTLAVASVEILLLSTAVFAHNSNALANVVEVRGGRAVIARSSDSRIQVTPGTVLRLGDLIIPSRGVIVVVQCSGRRGQREVRQTSGLGEVCPDNVQPRRGQRGSR